MTRHPLLAALALPLALAACGTAPLRLAVPPADRPALDPVRSREDLAELFGQFQEGFVHHRGVLGMDDLAHLLASGCHHFGVAMAGAGHTDAGGEVQVVLAIGPVDPAAKSVVHNDGGCLLECGAKGSHAFHDAGHICLLSTIMRSRTVVV